MKKIFGVLCLLALCQSSFIAVFVVPSQAMSPAFLPGEVLLINRLAYGFRLPFVAHTLMPWASPQQGDVVVVRMVQGVEENAQNAPGEGAGDTQEKTVMAHTLKRVVGVGGDTVRIKRGVITVNDHLFEGAHKEEGRHGVLSPESPFFFEEGRYFVPPGAVFVMGDAPDFSTDSRDFGYVRVEHIEGRVL